MQGMVLFQSLFFVSEIYDLLSSIVFRVMYKDLYLTNTNTTLAFILIRLNVLEWIANLKQNFHIL